MLYNFEHSWNALFKHIIYLNRIRYNDFRDVIWLIFFFVTQLNSSGNVIPTLTVEFHLKHDAYVYIQTYKQKDI